MVKNLSKDRQNSIEIIDETIYQACRGRPHRKAHAERKDLFDYNHWLIPLNVDNSHWVLWIVLFPSPRQKNWAKKIMFVYLDSMHRKNNKEDEVKVKAYKIKAAKGIVDLYLSFWKKGKTINHTNY